MKSTKPNFPAFAILLLGAVTAPIAGYAAPSLTSPYATDPQSSYVQDATSDGIATLNMVLCIMNSMRPAAMVNAGNYVALIDKNKCDSKSQSSADNSTSGSSGAGTATDYMTAIVNVTRTSDSDPMIGRVWMAMTENGQENDIFVHLSATQSPADAPPYGQFRVDYIGKSSGVAQFNGFVDANGANVRYLETGSNSSNNALTLTAASTASGEGTMTSEDDSTQPPTPVTFNFAYDSTETNYPAGVFRRYDGTHDVCFDRSKASAQKSVWRYGTYNANDGTRIDQANPGFPVVAAYGGNGYYGFASYWGINFQGLDLNGFADGAVAGVVVTDQRPGNHSTYSVSKSSGRLTRWTRTQQNLSAMDGVPFSFFADLTGQTSGNAAVIGFDNWQIQWNEGDGVFTVVGTQTCGDNGCVLSALNPAATVTGSVFDNMPISGWSNSFGGNLNIPPTGSAHVGTDAVYVYVQTDAAAGDGLTPSALYCLSQCPTADSAAKFVSSGNSPAACSAFDSAGCSPYGNGTGQQWGMANPANTVTYGVGVTGLTETSVPMVFRNPALFTDQYRGGVMTGRLFTSPFDSCPGNAGTVCEPPNPDVYYTWQTGTNPWNQAVRLTRTSDSSVVQFDPPENIAYTVPSGDAYGSWAGKSIQLQFNGFGNLTGVPGYCVNPTDNSQVDCSTAGARYVPMFSIPDGATMTLTSSNTPMIVKALDQELRLSAIDCATTSLAQPTASATLPSTSEVRDPSSSSDSLYIGVKPAVTDAPKVIDGVIQ